MSISRKEQWVQIAELDDLDQIRFTVEFQDIMGDLAWEARAFVGHLLGLWYDPFEHILDYTSGEAKYSKDQPGTFDRNSLDEPQDVVEYWATRWSENDKSHSPPHEAGTGLGLDVDWYRDVLRSKLVSIKLPKRLLIAYKDKMIERDRKFEEEFEQIEGTEVITEPEDHRISTGALRLPEEAISNIAGTYLFEKVGDAVAAEKPVWDEEKWFVNVMLPSQNKELGKLLFTANGQLIMAESDSPKLLEQRANED